MKKSLLLSLALGLVMMAQAKVAFLVPAGNTDMNSLPVEYYNAMDAGIPRQHEQSPERRAWIWFNEWYVTANMGRFICFNDLANIPSDVHAIWIYVDRVDFGTAAFDALFADYIDELQAFVNNGGSIFLCKQATRLEKDLVGATMANNEVIVPDYNDGGYQGAATWGVDYRFEFADDVVWSNADHPIFKDAPFRDDNYAELIWTSGGMLTDHNCGIGIGAMDMDSIKDVAGLTTFQARNNCKVLGTWANGDGCHYGGIIEFYPTGNRKGTVIMAGLAAYSYINNNAGNGWANTQVITRSTLRYLENLHADADQYKIAYLLPSSIPSLGGWYDGEQPEYNAAVWFRDTYVNDEKKGCFVAMEELPDLYARGVHTLWVNIERSMISPEDGVVRDTKDKVKAYIQAGGNVLMTKQATYLTYTMGRIGYAPAFESGAYTTEDRGQVRSIQTVMGLSDCVAEDERLDMSGHRIYDNMLSYWETKSMFFVAPECKKTYDYCSWTDYLRASDEDTHYNNCLIQRLRDFEADWHATVLAGQGGIGDYCLSNIVEFNATDEWKGRILTIGSAAYQWGSSNNNVERQNLTTLTANCLAYLANEPEAEKVYTRSVAAGHFGTICFEYAVPAAQIEGAEMYEIYSTDATTDSVILTKASNMEAGKPYIYYATASQIKLRYSGMKEEAKRYNGLIGFIGWSETDTYPVEPGYYVVVEDALYIAEDTKPVVLTPRYAYVDTAEIPAYTELPQIAYRKMKIVKTNPMAVDDVMQNESAKKYLRDGVLYIERNGKKYSVLGCGL
jgi:hypothetical protein